MSQQMFNWFSSIAPQKTVYHKSAATGTFQAGATAIGRLHLISSDKALYIAAGTGASVTVNGTADSADSGWYLPAGVVFPFHPRSSSESVGWFSADTTDANVTVAIVSG
jgi:hypothetical protein